MLNAIRLPLTVDAAGLQQDVAGFADDEWVPHFNKGYYEGDWSGIALRSVGGEERKLYPDPVAKEPYLDTVLLDRCPHARAVLDGLGCELTSARFLRLGAGSRIIEHTDYYLGFEDGEIRLHSPVTTSPDVTFLLEQQPLAMQPGEIWYINFNLPHAVTNHGPTARVHLVVDCVVNEHLTALIEEGEEAVLRRR